MTDDFGNFTGWGTTDATIDAGHEKFVQLRKDGNVVDPANYTITQGSTIITFSEAYLKTLANGTHWYVAEFTDGTSAPIRLNVNVAAAPTPNNPNSGSPATGDNSNMMGWLIALLASALGVLCILIRRKAQRVYDSKH